MANNYQSNTNEKLLKSFIKGFESSTVLLNTVSKQLVNDIDASTGAGATPVKMKRPTQYKPTRSADGDLTSTNANPVQVGSVYGHVSDNGYITVYVENTQVEEALETDQLDQLLMPIAEDMVITCESELAQYMTRNAQLHSGTAGTAINKWSDVANAGALFKEIGAPAGKKYAAINSFDETVLADLQTQLGVNPDVNQAWNEAVIKTGFAGLNQVMTTNNLDEYTSGVPGTGLTLAATPAATYVTYKDSYQMSLSLTGLTTTTGTLKAGQQLSFPASSLLNMRNGKVVRKSGTAVPFTVTVLADVTADGSGNATVSVSGAAIFEADGAYNTVSKALTSGDTVTVLDGATAVDKRPALAYCEGFVGMGSVVLPKLHATDSNIINHKGVSIRVHRFSDGLGNKNRYRFDILPTFATFNPSWGIQLEGTA
tara:strand:+ start:643 stop:1923 length:1281 start_codon:yes stop_codon:yes gene_type:complete